MFGVGFCACMCFEDECWGDEGCSSEEQTLPKSVFAVLYISHDGYGKRGGASMWPACVGSLYWCSLLTCEKRGGKFSIPRPVKAFLRCSRCSTQVHSGRECSAGRPCKSLPGAAASWGRRGSGVLRLWKNSLRAVFPGRWCPKTPSEVYGYVESQK